MQGVVKCFVGETVFLSRLMRYVWILFEDVTNMERWGLYKLLKIAFLTKIFKTSKDIQGQRHDFVKDLSKK